MKGASRPVSLPKAAPRAIKSVENLGSEARTSPVVGPLPIGTVGMKLLLPVRISVEAFWTYCGMIIRIRIGMDDHRKICGFEISLI